MAKKLTTQEFINRSNKIHDFKFDYTNVKYINSATKVEILCCKHNLIFFQRPNDHLSGNVGCNKCSAEKRASTNIQLYGSENPFSSKEIQNKIKQTNLKRTPSQSKEIQDKIKQTNLEKYGGVAPACNADVRQKIKQTNLNRYGVEYCLQSEIIKNKAQHTNLKRTPSQSKEIQNKIKQTNLEKYGGVAPACNAAVRQKIRNTCIEKYGVENAMQSEVIKQQYISNMIAKYGVTNPQYLSDVLDKRTTTNIDQYGVEHYSQLHIDKKSLKKLKNKEWLYANHILNKLPGNYIAQMLGVTPRTVYLYLHKHGIPIQNFYSSIQERIIVDFIKQYYNCEILTNSRKIIPPFELDIFLPDIKVAIEFNGIYWHSELQGKDRNYHLNKTEQCKKLGITLIHIWEHDWQQHPEIIKSILLSKINKLPKTADARKCIIDVISTAETKQFLINNHIQGYAATSVNIGLRHNNVLIAIMTFAKSRYNKQFEYELVRFSSIINTNVRGAASKLFAYFIKNYLPKSIISYSDVGRNRGNVYNIIGFKYLYQSKPNFHYIHANKNGVDSRLKFQKHKLEKQLENYDPTVTAWKNMINNGYDRIWDCGNDVFGWISKEIT